MTRPVRCIECGHDAHRDGLCGECARVKAAPWRRRGIAGQPVTDAPGALARERVSVHPTDERSSTAAHGGLGGDPDPPHPVIRCRFCGDVLPFGRIGRCDDCIGRGGNAIGCLVGVMAVLAIIAYAVLLVVVALMPAAPRGAQTTDLAPSRDLSATPGPSAGLPGAPLSEAGDRLRLPASPPPPAVVNVTTSEGLQGPTTPMPVPAIGSVLLGGKATWYRTPGLTGAAGPVLRDVLGDWRGERVTVCATACATVTLVDWCACGERGGEPTLIDLSRSAFARLANPSRGVLDVTIEIDVPVGPTLPPTDQEGAKP